MALGSYCCRVGALSQRLTEALERRRPRAARRDDKSGMSVREKTIEPTAATLRLRRANAREIMEARYSNIFNGVQKWYGLPAAWGGPEKY